MVTLGLRGPHASLNIAQAYSICELDEGHAKELVPAGEALDLVVPVVELNAQPKLVE